MEKYKNKYRIASARAQWWDYGWNGAYFITINTKDREHFFGKIVAGKMELSAAGIIADVLWHQIPSHSQFVELGDFVVMPDHIHGILIINKPDDPLATTGGQNPATDNNNALGTNSLETGPALIPTDYKTATGCNPENGNNSNPPTGSDCASDPEKPPQPNPTIGSKRFQNIGKNTVSSIIGSYKSAVTRHANRLELPNGWQTRFYDHIIRDNAEYQRISDYIIRNPTNWKGGNPLRKL